MTAKDYRYVLHDANDTDADSLDFTDGPAYVPYVSPVLKTSVGSRFGRFKHLAKRVARAPVVLFSGTSTSTLTLAAAWPLTGSKLSIVASSVSGHTDCAGHIIINSEDIEFKQAGTKTSTTALTALPTITTTGLDCRLEISVRDSGLAPVIAETETDLPCKIESRTKWLPSPQGGWTSIQSTVIEARGVFAVGENIKFDPSYPFDPTDGIDHIITAIRPKSAYMGKESIKVLQF
jgi:hypothetical protein